MNPEITLREYLIGQALAGLLAKGEQVPAAVTAAIRAADDVLARLQKERK